MKRGAALLHSISPALHHSNTLLFPFTGTPFPPMLKPVKSKALLAGAARFAVVASQYNPRYVNAMLAAARSELKRAGVRNLLVFRVPGAFEIPTIAARLAAASSTPRDTTLHAPRSTLHAPLDAIICLGVIFQGQTSHAQHIGWGVTHALAQIQVQHHIPVIHAVFVFEKEEHARVRCLGKKHNRGAEAARTALEMARVIQRLT